MQETDGHLPEWPIGGGRDHNFGHRPKDVT